MDKLIEKEVFAIESMRSGRSCLNLSSKIDWEHFPEYAERLLQDINGVIQKKTDSFDIRVWDVLVQGEVIRFVFDDFPMMVSLESMSEAGDKVLLKVKSCLEAVS